MSLLSLAYTLALITPPFWEVIPQAPMQNSIVESSSDQFQQPPPPPDAPKRRARGAGSRGSCSTDRLNDLTNITLVPMIPSNSWGVTVSAQPTLWIFVSYQGDEISEGLSGELILEDRSTNGERLHVSSPVVLPQQSGLFSIALQYRLESEQWYRWYLVVNCLGSETVAQEIEGYIYRQGEIASRSESDINWYINNGIWYDAFDRAVKLACNSSSDAANSQLWRTLLNSDDVQLGGVNIGFVKCV